MSELGKIRSFKDLNIRQKSKEIAKIVYRLTENKHFQKDWWLRDQLRRSVMSISSNIAEWSCRWGKQEFKYFLKIARWSCWELISQLLIISELNIFENKENLEKVLSELEILIRMIGKLIWTIS